LYGNVARDYDVTLALVFGRQPLQLSETELYGVGTRDDPVLQPIQNTLGDPSPQSTATFTKPTI
jgi:hypothetical protein